MIENELFNNINKDGYEVKNAKEYHEWIEKIKDELTYCISNCTVLSDEILNKLIKVINVIKRLPNINKTEKNKILNMTEEVFVISKSTNNYDKFKELNNRKMSKLNDCEILTYLNILINQSSCYIQKDKVEKYIKHYIEISKDMDKLIIFMNNNKDIFPKGTFKTINDLIYNKKMNILFNEIIKKIDKKNISFMDIETHLNDIATANIKNLSSKNILLMREVLSKVNSDNLLENSNITESFKLRDKINNTISNLISCFDDETRIKNDIASGKIQLSIITPKKYLSGINLNFDDLPFATAERIITIDDPLSPDLDGAFSIQKFDDTYILDVYISDVPSFLINNKKISERAYLRGQTIYLRNFEDNSNFNIDMLPPFLSHKYLSLHLGHPTNTISFNFVISSTGEIYSSSVNRQRIRVTNKLTDKEAQEIITNNKYSGPLQDDLRNYKQLCNIMAKNSNDLFLKNLKCNNINDLVAFPSVLVNYYIGHNADFAIYRENGTYTIKKESCYTHSATPIRRFVSNINLASFLAQNNISSIKTNDLILVEKNIEEIINHLNEREKISKVAEANQVFVKKYLKK